MIGLVEQLSLSGGSDKLNKVGFAMHEDFLLHCNWEGHPESPERLKVLGAHLRSSGIWESLHHFAAEPADPDIVNMVHTREYLDSIRAAEERGGGLIDEVETGISSGTFGAATRAVGTSVEAARRVLDGELDSAFCAVRPPGHHAQRDAAMGFCIFNNIAIAARWAIRRRGLQRVLIVDWDYHHGNGTQDEFSHDPHVLYFSTHCYPAWPMTGLEDERGVGRGEGLTVNAPLPPGTCIDGFREAFEQKLGPALRDFKPELVLISAGFDAHRADNMVPDLMDLGDEDFATLTHLVMELSDGSPIVSVLEGGYNCDATARSVEQHVRALVNGLPRGSVMQAVIRAGEPADTDAVATMETACFSTSWSTESLSPWFEGATGRLVWVAEQDGVASGYLLFTSILDEGSVDRIAVDPAFRGRGIGAQLLAHCLDGASQAGIKSIWLEVGAGNAAAIALYHSAGFKQVSRRRNYYADPPPEDALVMKWTPPGEINSS